MEHSKETTEKVVDEGASAVVSKDAQTGEVEAAVEKSQTIERVETDKVKLDGN